MIINVHAGHNPDGKAACGAVGLFKESTEARKVKNEVIKRLKAAGHTVYDCTCNNGVSQSDVLKKIVAKCNAHTVDLDVSIHFNAGASDEKGNGRTTGAEVLVYSAASSAKGCAAKVCEKISALGYRNRGVKVNTGLYYLKNTKAPSMLIECCFVDDKDDATLYRYKDMAAAIVRGITDDTTPTKKPQTSAPAVGALKAGTIVSFVGKKHYTSANAASGQACKPGRAKITQVYQPGKSRHPYHLVAVSGGGGSVHGWVNASDIKE